MVTRLFYEKYNLKLKSYNYILNGCNKKYFYKNTNNLNIENIKSKKLKLLPTTGQTII